MAEKRRRSCQDTQVALAGDNGSEAATLAAVTQNGAGSVRGSCTSMPRFLLHHIVFDHGLIESLGPDQPRQQGNLLPRKDWIQLRRIALSEWVTLPVQEVAASPLVLKSANTSAPEPAREAPGQVGSRWLVAVASVRKQDRWSLCGMSGQLQQVVGPRRGWGLLPECGRTFAFAVPAWAPSARASATVVVVPPGCHLTGCDSSFGHPFRPMQCGTCAPTAFWLRIQQNVAGCQAVGSRGFPNGVAGRGVCLCMPPAGHPSGPKEI